MREIDKAPMKSPKEALEWLDEHCIGEIVPLWVKMSASNALEKQIPKKPIKSRISYKCWCPSCDVDDEMDIFGTEYCPYCGQALDWSGDEE